MGILINKFYEVQVNFMRCIYIYIYLYILTHIYISELTNTHKH